MSTNIQEIDAEILGTSQKICLFIDFLLHIIID